MKDSTETFYSIPKASSIRFTAIQTAKSCFLSEFKHNYEMPKIVRFVDYETYDFVDSDQAGKDILADMLAGPVRILDELELEVLITWVLDKKERNMVRCILIPESKIGEILAKPFDTKHGTCHIATKQLKHCSYDALLGGKLYLRAPDSQKLSYVTVGFGSKVYDNVVRSETNLLLLNVPNDCAHMYSDHVKDKEDQRSKPDAERECENRIGIECGDSSDIYMNFPSLKSRFT